MVGNSNLIYYFWKAISLELLHMSTFKEESKESYNDKPKFAVNAILFIFTLEKFGSSTNFLPLREDFLQ